jgi:hypothetical protein
MKKRFFLSAFTLALLAAIGSLPAMADSTLYDNTGPTSGGHSDNGAFLINGGYAISDSFTLASNSTLTGVSLIEFLTRGDTLTSVDWAITGTAFGGSTYGSGTAVSVTTGADLGAYPNGGGYELYQESFSLSGLSLAAGTYYLQLQNAVTSQNQDTYWDVSNGLSDAAINGNGYSAFDLNGYGGYSGTNSETFQIMGNADTSATPEPSSFLLLGSGLAGLAGVIKRRLKA